MVGDSINANENTNSNSKHKNKHKHTQHDTNENDDKRTQMHMLIGTHSSSTARRQKDKTKSDVAFETHVPRQPIMLRWQFPCDPGCQGSHQERAQEGCHGKDPPHQESPESGHGNDLQDEGLEAGERNLSRGRDRC